MMVVIEHAVTKWAKDRRQQHGVFVVIGTAAHDEHGPTRLNLQCPNCFWAGWFVVPEDGTLRKISKNDFLTLTAEGHCATLPGKWQGKHEMMEVQNGN